MNTTELRVTGRGAGNKEALALTEQLGVERGLDHKSVLRLRLLAEELFGMLRGIAGEVNAEYWIECEGKAFRLHMKSAVVMTDEMREQFLKASSSGKNDAARGLMGKIRVMIADFLLSAKEGMPEMMADPAGAFAMGLVTDESMAMWSMAAYIDEVKRSAPDNQKAAEAWDELERSIIANIADDVRVGVRGNNVEITVYKKF